MRRRLKENIEIGDRVFASRDEYEGTVLDIMGNRVLVDGPFGEEYHNLNDLEKLGGDYEEDENPDFFKNRFTESKRKKVIRLTESDLARIVKRVIKENELSTFEGSANPMEFIYAPGMGEIASLDNLDPIAQKRGETEDIYNRFEVEFQNGDSDIEYIEFNGGRHTEREIKKMKKEIANFVSNPEKCAFVTTDNWLYLFLKASDVYIVKYKGDLYEESEF